MFVVLVLGLLALWFAWFVAVVYCFVICFDVDCMFSVVLVA